MGRPSSPQLSDREFAAALKQHVRADPLSVALRVLSLLLVYGLLARAIAQGQLSLALLWLPLAVQFVALMWMGLVLSYTLVECPVFRQTLRSWWEIVLWTLATAAPYALWLAYDPLAGQWDPANWLVRWQGFWLEARQAGLHWILAVGLLGMALSSLIEALQWRQRGGVFHWSQAVSLGFLVAALVLIGLLLMVLTAVSMAIPLLGSWWEQIPRLWWYWGLLLLAEMGALVLSLAIDGDLNRAR